MATGDAAGAAGLPVYTDSLLKRDIDTALNERGDAIAADRARLTKLEAQSISVPKFSVTKAGNSATLDSSVARVMPAAAFGSVFTKGGMAWSNGVLTVPKAGVYSINAVMKLQPNDYYAGYVMVTRNSTQTAEAAAVARGVVYPGQRASNNDPLVAPTVSASRLAVKLNAGDTLRLVCYQRNYGANSVQLDSGDTSLLFEVQWTDNQ